MSVSYMAERSLSDEIVRETDMNLIIVILSYVIMFIYIAIALGKFPHPVYSRVGLGLSGMFVVILSVTSSLGIAGYLGWSVTLIVTDVLPFLILAIGVDSMFIIVKEFNTHISESQTHEDRITERLQSTLAAVGPSITCAALCEICTFLLGLTTGISALIIFCSIAAFALVINYVLQITLFFCCLSLDVRRMENFRMDYAPCLPGCADLSKIPDLRRSFYDNNEPTEGKLKNVLKGDYILNFFKNYLAPCALSLPCLIISMILFFVFLGVSAYGITQLNLGLDQTKVLPLDSYLQSYFNELYTYGQTGSMGYMLIGDIDYEKEENQVIIETLTQDLANNKYVTPPVNNWLSVFLQLLKQRPDVCPELPEDVTGLNFYKAIEDFIEIELDSYCCTGYGICGQQFATDVVLKYGDVNGTTVPIGIKQSRLNFMHSALVTQDDFIMSVRSMEKYKDTYNEIIGDNVFTPFGMFYVYFGQYGTVRGLILQAFFFSAFTILVCSYLMTDLSTALITTIGVMVTIVDSVGIQWVLNLVYILYL